MKTLSMGNLRINNNLPFVVIAGPCVIESEEHCLFMAKQLKELTRELEIPFIFKSSWDKANRSSIGAYRGLGLEKGIRILKRVKEEVGVPILTDVHSVEQVSLVSEVADIIQIPAFLSRQTDLLLEVGKTNKIINVKKGQFLAPWDVENIAKKIESTGNSDICFTERGVSFGYNNLVSDMRSLAIMKNYEYPVIFDATHSVQLPGGLGNKSGGQREFVDPLSSAATAVGVAGLFFEVHDNPDQALCDGPNMLNLSDFKQLLIKLKKIDAIVKLK